MDDESTVRGQQHFILLRRYGEEGTPEYDAWNSELPTLFPGKRVRFGGIQDAVDDARKAVVERVENERDLGVKVAEGTSLGAVDILALIEANGGPEGLDLSHCVLRRIDLSRKAIRLRLPEGAEPDPDRISWLSMSTDGVDLRGVRLRSADLSNANFSGADLYTADLQHANLYRTDLSKAQPMWADFRHAKFWGTNLRGADLTGAELQGNQLIMAELEGAVLKKSRLQGADLHDSKSIQGVHWFGALLDRTRMSRHQMGSAIGDEIFAHSNKTPSAYLEAAEAYLAVKNNFHTLGRYGDVGWAYVKEQQMEKMAYHWAWRRQGWLLWRRYSDSYPPDWTDNPTWTLLLRWLRNWAYELLTGYGQRAWMPVLWGIAVILAFAGGYATAGNIAPDFAGDPATAEGSHNFLDALTHSIAAFATIGFNTLEPLGWGARLLTAIESALGIGLFALFIFTLGNRMSRS